MGLLETRMQELEKHIGAAEISIYHMMTTKANHPSGPVREPRAKRAERYGVGGGVLLQG
jgi:hypothetical protein